MNEMIVLKEEHEFKAPGTHLCGLHWNEGYLWHSDGGTGRIYKLQPETGEVLKEIPCPGVRTGLAYDGQYLWQVAGRPKRICVIDPVNGKRVKEIPLDGDPDNVCGLHIEGEHYWIGRGMAGVIEKRSLDTHETLNKHVTSCEIAGVVPDSHTLWYADYKEGIVAGLDLNTGEQNYRFRLHGQPTGLTYDGSHLWYCDFQNSRIVRVSVN